MIGDGRLGVKGDEAMDGWKAGRVRNTKEERTRNELTDYVWSIYDGCVVMHVTVRAEVERE